MNQFDFNDRKNLIFDLRCDDGTELATFELYDFESVSVLREICNCLAIRLDKIKRDINPSHLSIKEKNLIESEAISLASNVQFVLRNFLKY